MMHNRCPVWISTILVFLLSECPACGDEDYTQRIRVAVNRSIQLVEKSAQEYLSHRECFSCHHQAMPVIALQSVRLKGFNVDEKKLESQLVHTLNHFKKNVAKYKDGRGTGGQVDTAGYGLWALHAGGISSNEYTTAVVDYLLKRDGGKTFWRRSSERPPSEVSNFTATFVATQALKVYGDTQHQRAIETKLKKVSQWVNAEETRDNEDLVFKLNLLTHVKHSPNQLDQVVHQLWSQQKDDGGWSQLSSLGSDPYATATAIYALRKARPIKDSDPRLHKAIGYLLDRQKADGSWFVASRSNPFQEYFESGFPHGEDQFISITATCWAMMALADFIEATE